MNILFSMMIAVVVLMTSSNVFGQVPLLKAGVLKFGTVNWELQIIKAYGLDKKEGFELEVVPFAGKSATTTALQGGAVDLIVSDWIWVSRQRNEGRAFSFIPYSRIVGAMMARKSTDLTTLSDLKNKKIGVAGGPVDKSWLLMQALALKSGLNLAKDNEIIFGAPPLLSKKMESGELDAVITFWHFAAKLEAKGHKRLMDVSSTVKALGLNPDLPMIGYVFTPELSKQTKLVEALSRASRQAKEILRTDPQAWAKIRPMMKAKDEATFNLLKTGFLQGIPQQWGQQERSDAGKLFELLATLGGEKLVGKTPTLANGTFVEAVTY